VRLPVGVRACLPVIGVAEKRGIGRAESEGSAGALPFGSLFPAV